MKKKTHNTGLLITLEGGEGSGKTTLSQNLADHLTKKGAQVLLTRAPGGTELGRSIREILLHKKTIDLCSSSELLLFLADRAQHVFEVILPALQRGKIVVCDRFNDSTIAYQGAARAAFDLDYVEQLCLFATNKLIPDLTFYLDLDPEIGLKRAKEAIVTDGKNAYDRLEKEKLEFHQRVRAAYLNLAKKHSDRIVTINAGISKDQVFQEVVQVTERKLLEVSCA